MSKKEILKGLADAIIQLDDEKMMKLLKEGLKEGLSPSDMINDGLGAGLTVLGEGFANKSRFLSDLMVSGEWMSQAVEFLRPEMEKGKKKGAKEEVMVIGTVEGDLHDIGRKIVAATFTGAGYRVVDIGGNCSGAQFVKAVKENNATVVGASAILSPVKPYCEVINKALVDAGLRDKVIYIIGGWLMTQLWSDKVGADAYGDTHLDALKKVEAIKSGELKKLKDRVKK